MTNKIDKLLRTTHQYQASDLYISVGSKPALRINGDLVVIEEHAIMDDKITKMYLSEIMTEQQRKKFEQSLDIDFSINFENKTRFRVNMFMQRKGLGAVFRLIPDKIKTIEELDLPPQIKKIADFKSGLVLITGPTGSGKSTTLAAIINEINSKHSYHIITIEDPIEYTHENKKSYIEQREVGTHTLSFQAALRASLREDTDVILVGELRDLETISLALTAAETGHLVLATVHTSGAAKSLDRIIDVFPANQQNQIRTQVSESLKAAIWQQLIKRSDGTDRIAATEILFNNSAVSNLIRKGQSYQIESIMETHQKDGMQVMKKSILDLVQKGKITEEDAINFLPTIE